MKILILNYEFPPVGGGGGRIAADIGARLALRGHEIVVLSSHLKGLPRKEQRNGVSLHRVRCGRRRAEHCSVPEMAGFVVASMFPAWRLIRRWQPNVMHVHFAVPTGFVGWAVSRLTGVPYVLTAHLGDVPGGLPTETERMFRIVKPLTVPIWRHAAAATAVSPFVAGLCQEAYGVVPHVILNGIDVPRYSSYARAPSETVRMLWVGRMHQQKNLPVGLQQLAKLVDLEWTLDVVGDGPERITAERAADAAGLSRRVFFHGWLEEDRVRDFMGRADILYLPSHSEGLPMVALQALASGLAIVGSRVGGLEGVIEDQVNGFRCSSEHPEEFGEALRRVITDLPLLRSMQQASRRRAARFSLDRSVEQYEEVLRRASRSSGRP